jgi:iron-sulfur cluster assembly protein
MGTFHSGKSELHGMTLAVLTDEAVVVGRCDDVTAEEIIVQDADIHSDGEGGKTSEQWLARAAQFGVAPKHARVSIPTADVNEYGLLSEYYDGVGKAAAKPATPKPAPDPAPAPAVDSETIVALTADAVAEIRRIVGADAEPGQGLRLGVAGGGCSGLVYKVALDDRRDGDVVVPHDGFDVLMDRKSTIYLRGVELDYQGGLDGRGFQFRNPNAANTCGCGESFSV